MFETFVLIRDLVVCRCIYYYVVRVVSMRVREKERERERVCVWFNLGEWRKREIVMNSICVVHPAFLP